MFWNTLITKQLWRWDDCLLKWLTNYRPRGRQINDLSLFLKKTFDLLSTSLPIFIYHRHIDILILPTTFQTFSYRKPNRKRFKMLNLILLIFCFRKTVSLSKHVRFWSGTYLLIVKHQRRKTLLFRMLLVFAHSLLSSIELYL